MTPIPAADQIAGLKARLLQCYVDREDSLAKVTEAEATIKAIRNVLAGLPIGQQLQAEAPPPAPPPANVVPIKS